MSSKILKMVLEEIINNINCEKIISTRYNKALNKHTIKYMDVNDDICVVTVETQGLGNMNNVTSVKKLSITNRRIAIEKLMNKGLTQTEIANKLNVSQKTVSNDIKLLNKIKDK